MKSFFYVFLILIIVVTIIGWISGSEKYIVSGKYELVMIALARLFGLFAAIGSLAQVLSMTKIPWVAKGTTYSFHHRNGFVTILFVLLHPLFLGLGYSELLQISYAEQMTQFLTEWDDVARAAIASFLFIVAAVLSIISIRRLMKYKVWYYIHLSSYLAVLLAFGHQLEVGGDMTGWFRNFWLALYVFVAANVAYWRAWPLIIGLIKKRQVASMTKVAS